MPPYSVNIIVNFFNVPDSSMNQRIAYARVSIDDQHLDLQRDALRQVECGVIYEEAVSGQNTAAPSSSSAARHCGQVTP